MNSLPRPPTTLKNSLTKISLISQLIPKAGMLNEKQTEYIKHICEAAGNMDRLVQNLLELAKIDAGGPELKLETVNVNELVSETVEEFRLQAKAREQEMQFEKAKGEPEVQGDLLSTAQALRNLVSNAHQIHN